MASPFTPAETDTALAVLKQIFGDVISHVANGTAATSSSGTMLGEAFSFFNSGTMFFGCLLLTGITILGIANTANDGAALGKKWSSLYTPLRTLTAGSLLIPSSSGFCGIQILILTMVAWSIGFASQLWEKVVDYVISDQIVNQVMLSVQEDRSYNTIAINALRLQLCARAVEKGFNLGMGETDPIQMALKRDTAGRISEQVKSFGTVTQYTTKYYYADAKENQNQHWSDLGNLCGAVYFTGSYPKAPAASSGDFQSALATGLTTKITTIKFNFVSRLFSETGEGAAMTQSIVDVIENPDATKKVDPAALYSMIEATRKQMQAQIRSAVQQEVSSQMSSLRDRLAGRGWAWAGSMHMDIARIKDMVRNSTALAGDFETTSSSTDTGQYLVGDVKDAADQVMGPYLTVAAELSKELNKRESTGGLENTNTSSSSNDAPNNTTPSVPALDEKYIRNHPVEAARVAQGFFSSMPVYLMRYITQWTNYKNPDGTVQDPILKIKDLGDYMTNTAEIMVAAKMLIVPIFEGVLKASDGLANQPVIGTAASVVSGAVKWALESIAQAWTLIGKPLMYGLILGGYTLGQWIPMLPFHIFFLGFVGWVIVVIEAVAAAPLFAAMHLTPESNDSFIGSQMQGYLLLLSVFFRPPLMILGLVASLAVMPPIVDLLNEMFLTTFWTIQGNAHTGVFRIIGGIILYCTMLFSTITMVMALPQSMPDRILRWIGAGIGDMGEQNTMSEIKHGQSHMSRGALMQGQMMGEGMARAKAAKNDQVLQARQAESSEKMASDIGAMADAVRSAPEGHGGQGAFSAPQGGNDKA